MTNFFVFILLLKGFGSDIYCLDEGGMKIYLTYFQGGRLSMGGKKYCPNTCLVPNTPTFIAIGMTTSSTTKIL